MLLFKAIVALLSQVKTIIETAQEEKSTIEAKIKELEESSETRLKEQLESQSAVIIAEKDETLRQQVAAAQAEKDEFYKLQIETIETKNKEFTELIKADFNIQINQITEVKLQLIKFYIKPQLYIIIFKGKNCSTIENRRTKRDSKPVDFGIGHKNHRVESNSSTTENRL